MAKTTKPAAKAAPKAPDAPDLSAGLAAAAELSANGGDAGTLSDTDYPPEALGTRERAQKALKFALHRRPNLEADLADVIAYVGLPAEAVAEDTTIVEG